MKLIFSPAALEDLQAISNYTLDVWGEEQEGLYLKGLWRKLEEIRANPEIHRLRTDVIIGCRSARHEKHVIFFSLEEDHIAVIRILHGAMYFPSHLSDDFL